MMELQRCTVVLDGPVTGAASERVEEALGLLQPGGTLLIDLSQATSVEAVMLAHLVRLLQARQAPVSVKILGLCRRDGQLLHYLGLDPAHFASATWSALQEDALG